MSECGTYGGYSRHLRRGEEVDEACQEAKLKYGRDYRRRHPERDAQSYAREKARRRALSRLADLYFMDYERLLREEVRRQRKAGEGNV